jgi:hypothetical protein
MANALVFNSQKDLINHISDYLINHSDTIAIVNRDLRKKLIKTLLINEDFDKFKDISNSEQDVLFIIKTGYKQDRTLTLKVCDAYNQEKKYLKMVDIENILIVDGLISSDEENSINYYKELCNLKLANI